MRALRLTEESLADQIMGSPKKVALAWLVRKHTCVRNEWIKERLMMGTATTLSQSLRRIESSRKNEWGYEEFQQIKTIKL
jgi:hypothetical protein